MKSKISLILLALGALVLPLHAAKGDGSPKKHKQKQEARGGFKKKDADHDGFLTMQEFAAGGKVGPKREKAFIHRDKDGNGKLSRQEFKAGGKGGKKKKKG